MPRIPCWLYAALCLCLNRSALGAEWTLSLDTTEAGALPSEFEKIASGSSGVGPGDWSAIWTDAPRAFAPLTSRVETTVRTPAIAHTKGASVDDFFDLLVFDEPLGDFSLELEMRIEAGEIAQMAGVAFRLHDSRNYYVARASVRDRTFRFYKYFEGLRGDLIGPEISMAPGAWVPMKVECKGPKISLWFGGEPILDGLEDFSFPKGQIALWTKSDTQATFRNIKLTYTPLKPYATELIQQALVAAPTLIDLRIYAHPAEGAPLQVIAAKDPLHEGQPGGKNERDVLANESMYYGKEGRYRTVTVPLRDRNGEPVAALRMHWKGFPGETKKTSLRKANEIADFLERKLGYRGLMER